MDRILRSQVTMATGPMASGCNSRQALLLALAELLTSAKFTISAPTVSCSLDDVFSSESQDHTAQSVEELGFKVRPVKVQSRCS